VKFEPPVSVFDGYNLARQL